jgi:hypothetical protein
MPWPSNGDTTTAVFDAQGIVSASNLTNTSGQLFGGDVEIAALQNATTRSPGGRSTLA